MRTAFFKSTGQTPVSKDGDLLTEAQISSTVQDVLASTQFIDIHTHLFSPAFGKIGLWGIDELLTYHYLEAELFRHSDMTPESYWSLPRGSRRTSSGVHCSSRTHRYQRRRGESLPYSKRSGFPLTPPI